MIVYCTKLTLERYKIQLPSEMTPPHDKIVQGLIDREKGDRLLEWGAKLFYFDKKKCVQVLNFASKFTLFLFDIKMGDIDQIGRYLSTYMDILYEKDPEMLKALRNMWKDSSIVCFERITDKVGISSLNHNQLEFANDGYRFYDFIVDGTLDDIKINEKINYYCCTMKINNKTEYIYPIEMFRKLVLERYGDYK